MSTRGDTESRSGLAEVVSEVSLALARRSADWVASASELEHFSNRNAERAEATFSQYSVQLRTKVWCSAVWCGAVRTMIVGLRSIPLV